jgi:hypothetical protein
LFANLDPASKVKYLVSINSPFRYILAAYLVAALPSLMLAAIMHSSGLLAQNKILTVGVQVWVDFIGVALFSPVAETLLMFPIFRILRMSTTRIGWLSFWSAITWALLHSALHPIWGLTTFWTFFVLSFSFLLWEPRGKRWAFAIPATIHSLNNTIVFVIVFLSRSQA